MPRGVLISWDCAMMHVDDAKLVNAYVFVGYDVWTS